jgi:hypothetical protein
MGTIPFTYIKTLRWLFGLAIIGLGCLIGFSIRGIAWLIEHVRFV